MGKREKDVWALCSPTKSLCGLVLPFFLLGLNHPTSPFPHFPISPLSHFPSLRLSPVSVSPPAMLEFYFRRR
jgi:hypothetical protein